MKKITSEYLTFKVFVQKKPIPILVPIATASFYEAQRNKRYSGKEVSYFGENLTFLLLKKIPSRKSKG
ncbi:hypothetical protein OA86_12885 [Kaistella jeonii]|uniref:Uncharacterized protein n=1 Tax=Kaistella jeonii TaxID=266749 RepID=A0A0C1CUX4_9FLAO|nr:hypothetical protein OA86_12885 [Kaistella jeonii]